MKITHPNHPWNKWIRKSLSNWRWTRNFVCELQNEYNYRYGKIHKSYKRILDLPEPNIEDVGKTKFYVNKNYQHIKCPVNAYRALYINEKQHLAKWK